MRNKLHTVETKIPEATWAKLKKKSDAECRTVAGQLAWLIKEYVGK